MDNQNNLPAVSEQGSGLQIVNAEGNRIKTIIGENAQALSAILMDNIKKVQDNPGYLPQAKEVRDQVGALVNLARVEVDMIREVRKVIK